MGRTTWQEVDRLPDPLAQYNFDLVIPNVPGVDGIYARDFKTKIMSTVIPGRTIEPIQIDLKGVTKEFAGRVQYPRVMPFELVETRDLASRKVLLGWHKFTRNDSSLGAYANDYMTTAELLLYDDMDNIVRTIRLKRAWLESFDDAAVDGGSSAAVTISGTLKYFIATDVVDGVEI